MSYIVEVLEGISIIRFTSQPTVEEVKSVIDEMSISQPYLRLWDLSVGINFSSDELQTIAYYGNQKLTRPSKVAIVAQQDLSFGLSRVHEAYRSQQTISHQVFRTVEEGVKWLKSKNA